MNPDHLHHWPAIGAHIGVSPEAARHMHRTQGLPVFKIGKTVAASRAEINGWLDAQRARGLHRGKSQGAAERDGEAA